LGVGISLIIKLENELLKSPHGFLAPDASISYINFLMALKISAQKEYSMLCIFLNNLFNIVNIHIKV
jgi:hypothetical protein